MNLLTANVLMLQVKAGDLDKMGLLFERYRLARYVLVDTAQKNGGSEITMKTIQGNSHVRKAGAR